MTEPLYELSCGDIAGVVVLVGGNNDLEGRLVPVEAGVVAVPPNIEGRVGGIQAPLVAGSAGAHAHHLTEHLTRVLRGVVDEPVAPRGPQAALVIGVVHVRGHDPNVIIEPGSQEVAQEGESTRKRSKSKGRTLEFDEDLGQVVVKRRRKRSRSQDDWEDYMDEDF